MSTIRDSLRFLYQRSSRRYTCALLVSIVSGVCNTALLALISNAITTMSVSRRMIVALSLLCIVAPLTKFLSETLLIALSQHALMDLRVEMTRKILTIPLRRLEVFGAGKILALLMEDIPAISVLASIFPTIIMSASIVVSCMLYMAWLDPRLFMSAIAIIVPGITAYQLTVRYASSSLSRARVHGDALQGHFQALTQGLKELKVNARLRSIFFKHDLTPTAAAIRKESVRGMSIYSWGANWGQLLIFIVLGALIWMHHADRARNTVNTFALCLVYMVVPIQSLVSLLPALARVAISIKSINDVGLLFNSVIRNGFDIESAKAPRAQKVELTNVVYSYHDEIEASSFRLGPLSAGFDQGTITFIVGGNGSGKSTLLKVLVGLYAPDEGSISVDGRCLDAEMVETYMQLFSVMFTGDTLFDSCMASRTEAAELELREMLQRLNLSAKVTMSNYRFKFAGLSTGERKRLALVSAVVDDRSIYIFDEWAANQDPQFKNIFYFEILPTLRARGKTVIVATHDERYYGIADRVIRLQNGAIADPVEASQSQMVSSGSPQHLG